MGVAPFFYTNIADYNKNWYWGPDTLWFDRWEQVLQIMPDFVQIMYVFSLFSCHYLISASYRFVLGFRSLLIIS
jgi:glucan endo-1,3-alpha-glucosidase